MTGNREKRLLPELLIAGLKKLEEKFLGNLFLMVKSGAQEQMKLRKLNFTRM
ncbi:MAG: hypothetical protein AVDCRST_MAG96-321 [uncultured Segetibacter sp.]|uniref:Uncharacterized protein n=1 Tax=uncultured Segetibacter sp. TaxID=481133 RepID=A0A6J4RJZ4_9BACT|nr:MAG: hypothetical protein AVDCRST_MAG96-321 [uncultured Segetibacter sp.]